jgi:hypothetical protein
MYLEFDGDWASRQVEQYDGRWFHGDARSKSTYHDALGPALCDQPLSELGLPPECEITPEEFEAAWSTAISRK